MGRCWSRGGINASTTYISSAELYDPASGTWTATGPLTTGRHGHTATLLPNGKVLVAGGVTVPLLAVNLSSTKGNCTTQQGQLERGIARKVTAAHSYHTATLLLNGKVLIVGRLLQ